MERKATFEESLKRLEEITGKLKSDETGLEDAIKLYEEASKLSKDLTKRLDGVKRKLESIDADGNVEEVELDE